MFIYGTVHAYSLCSCLYFTRVMQPLLQQTLLAMLKLLQFYSNSFSEMNLDGLFGLRIIEGQCKHFQRIAGTANLKQQFFEFSESAVRTAIVALPQLESKDPEYFKKLRPIVEVPWSIFRPLRHVNRKYLWKFGANFRPKKMTEDQSDSCMTELLDPNCEISQNCVNLMLKNRGTTGYALLHQLLFVSVAEIHRHCVEILEKFLISYDEFESELCSNGYEQVRKLVANGFHKLNDRDQDLFLEYVFVCGTLGFQEFVNATWIQTILSWQLPNGCFGAKNFDETENLGRKLLREIQMNDGCFSHKSAVAAGALTAIIRVLLEIDFGPDGVAIPIHYRNLSKETSTFLAGIYLSIIYLIVLLVLVFCCRRWFHVIYGAVWRRFGINRLR